MGVIYWVSELAGGLVVDTFFHNHVIYPLLFFDILDLVSVEKNL